MNLLSLYHGLPAWTRCAVASARGAYLQRWRYNRDTDRLVGEALERETWSSERWKAWGDERLAFVLHRAATRVPFYRDLWTRRRAGGYRGSWELIENWPILEKEDLRSQGRALIADDVSRTHMFHEHSSGSTGTPVNLWVSADALRLWYALFEARWRKWNGVSRRDNWAILGGQLVSPVKQNKPPFWVWNAAMRQLYMSSYHLSQQYIPHYLEALKRYRIEYLWGYTSSLYSLAEGALRDNRSDLHMRVIITNAEPLLEHQRATIAAGFHCPVKETYGMSEMVAGASECEHSVLHLWPEAGYIEIESEKSSLPGKKTGQMICTGLCNPDMPLIRYRIGDRATMPVKPAPCACGRTLPVLSKIEGRSDDVLFTADGRAIGRLDPIFKGDFLVREAQIIQERLDAVRLRYVPGFGCTEKHVQAMLAQLRARIGEVRVETECVSAIARGPNNKFRAVICNLPPEQRRSLLQ
jgi:phenylacetate-CoA ligase